MLNQKMSFDGFRMLKAGSKIIEFTAHSKLKVFDMRMFTGGSLLSSAEAWGVPKQFMKSDFNHDKVFNWASAMKHREEVTEYLELDVLCLGHLFQNYWLAQWKNFGVDMSLCQTGTQMALRAWESTCPVLHEIYKPKMGLDEESDRAAYYGGRVMCQYQSYTSSQWDTKREALQLPQLLKYDDVTDYLVLIDANSLYPTAQRFNQYAHGQWSYDEVEEERQEALCHRLNHCEDVEEVTEEMKYRCYKVNITCPKDLLTSFLITKNKDGSIKHSLEDIVEQWYWGCELEEAIILGYRITHVHMVKRFEKLSSLFSNFVTKCYQGRKDAEAARKPDQALGFKMAMNSVTGKFGQKTRNFSTNIYPSDFKPSKKSENFFRESMNRIQDYHFFFSNDNHNNAVMITTENDKKGPTQPIYLSGQILAYARVLMSKTMRLCDSYRNPARAIYYTDTDSLVLPSICIPDLTAAGLIGPDLGQFKCDVTDSTKLESFGKIVRAVWSATKGPYSLIYIKPDGVNKKGEAVPEAYWEKVRLKGIPHPSNPTKYLCDNVRSFQDEMNAMAKEGKHTKDLSLILSHALQWKNNNRTTSLSPQVIGTGNYYIVEPVDNEDPDKRWISKRINLFLIKQMMEKEYHVYCCFGGMKRQFFSTAEDDLLRIKPDFIQRQLSKTDWWGKSKRQFALGHTPESLTYPPFFEFQ